MGASRFYLGAMLLTVLLSLAAACAPVRPSAPRAYYYVTSEIAYLRDGPRYDGRVLAQLYKGDQTEKLESDGSDWWRVRSGRSGQEGWIQGSLLSPDPVPVEYHIVRPATVPLRECPGEQCPSLQLLYRGDKVQRVEKNDKGWWLVLAAKGRSLGWLPESALEGREDLSPPQTVASNYYYVALARLKLRQIPINSAKTIRVLSFNNQLQKLAESPSGWFKVRHPKSGAVGWVASRYLETLPMRFPRRPKGAKKKGSPEPGKQELEEPMTEPEIM